MLLLLLATAPAHAADAVPDRFIVGFEKGAAQSEILQRVGARVVRRLGSIRATAALLPRDGRALQALRRHEHVRYVEPDWLHEASKTPNDPDYEQYALGTRSTAAAGAPAVWDQATSCASIAVLDSGVQYGHPDLRDNVWHNPNEVKGDGKDNDKNGYVDDYYGVDLVDGTGSAADDNGHGTHVAGVIGGRGNNATGVSGLCWSAKIVPIKFLNSRGRGATSGAIEGIEYAWKRGLKVLNGSFGADEKSTALGDAVDKAREKGLLLVFAAGNDGANVESAPIYPASYTDDNILAVASITSTGALASYSNYGAKSVDLAAPGDKIYSTYPSSAYKSLSGTSMASPLVAATAAFLKKRDSSLTYKELRTAIRSHTKASAKLSGKVATGGQLDIAAALDAVT